MSHVHTFPLSPAGVANSYMPSSDAIADTVMAVLRGIRARRSDGAAYDEHSNLTDSGFTSVEMVKVMLGVEAAFDLMVPQELITPEHFSTPVAIAAMLRRLTAAAA